MHGNCWGRAQSNRPQAIRRAAVFRLCAPPASDWRTGRGTPALQPSSCFYVSTARAARMCAGSVVSQLDSCSFVHTSGVGPRSATVELPCHGLTGEAESRRVQRDLRLARFGARKRDMSRSVCASHGRKPRRWCGSDGEGAWKRSACGGPPVPNNRGYGEQHHQAARPEGAPDQRRAVILSQRDRAHRLNGM